MTTPSEPVTALASPLTAPLSKKKPRYRVLVRGAYFRVQVKRFGFWRHIDAHWQTRSWLKRILPEWMRDRQIDFIAKVKAEDTNGWTPEEIVRNFEEAEEQRRVAATVAKVRDVRYIE